MLPQHTCIPVLRATGIVGEGDTESETGDEDTEVEMTTIKEKEGATADDELGDVGTKELKVQNSIRRIHLRRRESRKSDGRNEKYEAL